MIYNYRVYTLKPGAIPDYMAAVRDFALPIRKKYGIKLAGWYYSDIGDLDEVVHIWAYKDEAHMAEAQAQVSADPEWQEKYIPSIRGLITAQRAYVMLSPDFAPVPA